MWPAIRTCSCSGLERRRHVEQAVSAGRPSRSRVEVARAAAWPRTAPLWCAAAKRGSRNGAGTTLRMHSVELPGRAPPVPERRLADVEQRVRVRSVSSQRHELQRVEVEAPAAARRRRPDASARWSVMALLQLLQRGEQLAGRRLGVHLVRHALASLSSAIQQRLQPGRAPSSAGRSAGAAPGAPARRCSGIELGACTSGGRARPGCAPRRPARRRASRWPASGRAAGRCSRSSSCSRRRPRRSSAPVPGPGSRGRPRAPAPPRAALAWSSAAAADAPARRRAPRAGGRRSPWPAGRNRRGRPCRGARRPCRGPPVPAPAAAGPARCAAMRVQRIQRQAARPERLGGQEEDLVELLRRARP